MKKLSLLSVLLVMVMAFAGCSKSKNDNSTSPQSQGVSFSIAPGNTGGVKSTSVSTDCFSKTASYAKITIDNKQTVRAIFYINGVPYTNTMQMTVGNHT